MGSIGLTTLAFGVIKLAEPAWLWLAFGAAAGLFLAEVGLVRTRELDSCPCLTLAGTS